MRFFRRLLLVLLVACGSDPIGVRDASTRDASPDAPFADAPFADAAVIDANDDAAPDAGVTDAAVEDAEVDAGSDAGPPVPPFPDLAIGPYESTLPMLIASMRSNAVALDTGATYGHSAAQGYLLQAIAELLRAARAYTLPERAELLDLALGEIAELEGAADRTTGAAPAFGLDTAWDAFGDGSTNPAFTAYVWQSGMVAYGVAAVARELQALGDPRAADTIAFARALIGRWDAHLTSTPDGDYWWYSSAPADAIAVHNTSALLAMAHDALAEATGESAHAEQAERSTDFLWARLRGNPTTGYAWNYADDGYPAGSRRAEDASHALVTLQAMALAGRRGWWPENRIQGVSRTLLGNLFAGNPARLNGRVDGTSGGESEWTWTRASVIGFGAHGDIPGADPEVFDTACSILFSSYLSRFERALSGATLDSARTLALAMLLARRPAAFAEGTRWRQMAGPDDDALPTDETGGTRFYTVDWNPPANLAAGLTLPARTSSALNANLLVDLPSTHTGRVVVSLTYRSSAATTIREWDGAAYHLRATLPRTADEDGVVRWMRTTFELDPAIRHDYQAAVPGVNVLLEVAASGTAVHAIEATPL